MLMITVSASPAAKLGANLLLYQYSLSIGDLHDKKNTRDDLNCLGDVGRDQLNISLLCRLEVRLNWQILLL